MRWVSELPTCCQSEHRKIAELMFIGGALVVSTGLSLRRRGEYNRNNLDIHATIRARVV